MERIAALDPATIAAIQPALDQSADELVDSIKSIAPVSELEMHPGELRDSTHKEAGSTSLSVNVVVDAKDAKGHGFAPHVEFGHKTKDGKHVAAVPFFFPSVRVGKKKLSGRISRAMGVAIKQAAGGGGGS